MADIKQLESAGQWSSRWQVKSMTRGSVYVVGLHRDGHYACSCPAWKFQKGERKDCKHVKAVVAFLGLPVESRSEPSVPTIVGGCAVRMIDLDELD